MLICTLGILVDLPTKLLFWWAKRTEIWQFADITPSAGWLGVSEGCSCIFWSAPSSVDRKRPIQSPENNRCPGRQRLRLIRTDLRESSECPPPRLLPILPLTRTEIRTDFLTAIIFATPRISNIRKWNTKESTILRYGILCQLRPRQSNVVLYCIVLHCIMPCQP